MPVWTGLGAKTFVVAKGLMYSTTDNRRFMPPAQRWQKAVLYIAE